MVLRVAVLPLLISLLAACSGPGYYLQAISGQWKLMHTREDIQSLLNDPATEAQLAEKLHLAEQLKTFAQQSLDLPHNDSYSSYVDVGGEALVWNVVATGEFALQPKRWCFVVAGCVPYRGFFKQPKADAAALKLKNKGMDVMVAPAAAYSTLGWFSDPLLSTMLTGSDTRLAAYLFHELAHQRIYSRGDGMFNEAYASFVESLGVKAWLKSTGRQEALGRWQQRQDAGRDFTTLLGRLRDELTSLYLSGQSEAVKRQNKTALFQSYAVEYENLVTEKWKGKSYFQGWFDGPPNNAKIALYDTYEGGQCAFQELWEQANGQAAEFHHLAEQKSRLQKQARQSWLKQSCKPH